MEIERYLNRLDRVSAPPGFEQEVLARLRKKKRQRTWLRRVQWSVAAAVLILAVVQLAVQPLLRRDFRSGDLSSGLQPASTSRFVVEPVDLKREIKTCYEEPEVIFILEQVSDNRVQQIKY